MIDKKGYDNLMAQIAKELKIDEQKLDKQLNEKYGKYKFFGKTAQEDREREAKRQAKEKKEKMAKFKRIREKVHFTQFGGKKAVLKSIMKNDFKDSSKTPNTPDKRKTISTSKTDAKKSNPDLIIHSGGTRAERMDTIKTKLDKVRGAGSSFNEKATPSKSASRPER